MSEKQTVGFIGLGVMGNSMAKNLIAAGYELFVYTRTKAKAEELLHLGAKWAETPKEVAENANMIITIVGYPKDVEEVYLGENGLIPNGQPGSILIDMTTSSPSLAKKLYDEGKKANVHVLDAPVSGGDIGAKEGRLAIMVGGERTTFEKVLPILQVLGKNIIFQGEAGAGQHTKLANQIAIASNMIGVCEALVYAKRAGLDLEKVLASISTGAAGSWSLSNLAPRILRDDYTPGFFVKHFIKDMTIALEEAERMNLMTPGLALAKELYEQLANEGKENFGTQVLYTYWQ